MIGDLKSLKHSLLYNYYFFKYFYGITSSRIKALKVNSERDLVIEGFPRSANSFLVYLIEELAEGELSIAHHIHNPFQLVLGLEYAIPCFLIIRRPTDSCISLCIRNENVSLRESYKFYIEFHQKLLMYKDKLKVIDFEEMINLPIETIVEKFSGSIDLKSLQDLSKSQLLLNVNTKIEIFSSKQNKGKANEIRISRPSRDRDLLKKNMLLSIEADLELKKMESSANELYHKFTEK